MSTRTTDRSPEIAQSARRVGYVISIAINVTMLIVVQNLLTWGWLPFLTAEFAEVVPWISLSLIASIVVSVVYQLDDSQIIRAAGQIGINLISIWVTYTILTVFPFDFSADEFDWEVVARVALVFAIVGAGIGALVEAIKLASSLPQRRVRRGTTSP